MSRTGFVILLIDDNRDEVELFRRALEAAGVSCSFRTVGNKQAAAYFRAAETFADRIQYPLPSLVLVDTELDETSALELLAFVRGLPELKRVPVVILSPSSEPGAIQQAYNLGANSYLVKPATFDEWVGMMKAISIYWGGINIGPNPCW